MSLLCLKSFFQGFPRPYKIWLLSSLVAHLYIVLLAFSCPQGTLTMLLSGLHSYLLITPLFHSSPYSLSQYYSSFTSQNQITSPGKSSMTLPDQAKIPPIHDFFLTICLHIKIMKISNTYYTRHCAKSFIQFI